MCDFSDILMSYLCDEVVGVGVMEIIFAANIDVYKSIYVVHLKQLINLTRDRRQILTVLLNFHPTFRNA